MNASKQTKKIAVRFPKRLKAEMQRALIKRDYGLHGKSKWLKEAIVKFLNRPNFFEYVEQGMDINQSELTEVEAFYLDIGTVRLMKDAFVKIRTQYPLFEGVQSAFIRSAVIYQLMLK